MISSDLGNILFGKWVYGRTYNDLRENIRKAHIARNVYGYVCSSLFYAVIASIMSLFLGFIIARTLIHNNFMIFLITAIFSISAGYLTYNLLISYPSFIARSRMYRIDLSMSHAVTYLYALSRGGMSILDMFKSLSSYTHIYGGTAEEISLIVRDIEYFGIDVVTALNNASQRTSSIKFKDFIDNLISVINSGGNLSGFFKNRSDFYQEIAQDDQKIFLETLGVFAEVYVSGFVAAPLFLIVIIVVMGLLKGGIELYLSIIIYDVIPFGTLLYVFMVDTISGIRDETPVIYTSVKKLDVFKDVPQLKAEESLESENIIQLEQYEKRSKMLNILFNPLNIFVDKPVRTFFITVPIALIYLFFSIRNNVPLNFNFYYVYTGTFISAITFQSLKAVENYFLMALLFVIIPFTVFFEYRKNRIRKLEDRMPDFLKRLAGMNEAGLTLTQSIAHTAQSNLGVLTDEITKVHRAIEWGTITVVALLKFEKRIESGAISRVITLIVKASESTSDIRNVLAIAAKDADIAQRLKRERLSNLFIYVIIIYISFFVFLFIIIILLVHFLGKMPTGGETSMFSTTKLANMKTLFYHASLLQGLFSGLVAGQMGEGNPSAGLKHSILMLFIAYIVFAFFLQGV